MTARFSITISEEINERLELLAKAQSRTKSSIINELLGDRLGNDKSESELEERVTALEIKVFGKSNKK